MQVVNLGPVVDGMQVINVIPMPDSTFTKDSPIVVEGSQCRRPRFRGTPPSSRFPTSP